MGPLRLKTPDARNLLLKDQLSKKRKGRAFTRPQEPFECDWCRYCLGGLFAGGLVTGGVAGLVAGVVPGLAPVGGLAAPEEGGGAATPDFTL
jgi:hypothetical protein